MALDAALAGSPAAPALPRLAYISHPLGGAPKLNRRRIRRICASLVREGVLPVAPQLLLPCFLNYKRDLEPALGCRLAFLARCDEVRVFADAGITPGMRQEITQARLHGIPVRYYHDLPEPL